MNDLATRSLAVIVTDPNSKWSSILAGHGNLPQDITKFHLNLVLLDHSPEQITMMLDCLQADFDAWQRYREEAHKFADFVPAAPTYEFEFDWIADPHATERDKWKREAREIFAHLSSLDKSDWDFARALRVHCSRLRRHRPEPGEFGYSEIAPDLAAHEADTSSDGDLHCMDGDWDFPEFDPNYVDRQTTKERHDALVLLRRKLAHACGAQAALFDAPLEVMLYCAVVSDGDVDACVRLTDFFHTWRRYGYPVFLDGDQLESFIAYWVKTRWDSLEPVHSESVPKDIREDIRTIRAFCGWSNMPAISGFAQSMKSYAGDPLDDRMYVNPRALRIYLSYVQRWFVEEYLGEDDDFDH